MKDLSIDDLRSKITILEKEITALRLHEEEYKTMAEQLKRSQKMEALATMAGGIAHDFNNILQTILGNAELLLLNKKEGDQDYKKLMQIQQAATKGSELSRQFITLGRKTTYKSTSINLNEQIVETANLLKRTVPKMISIKTELANDLKKVHVDSGHVEQVIINLAINSRDAMPDGGELKFKTTNNDPLNKGGLYAKGIQQYVLLEVSDTGLGMAEEVKKNIFRPFFTTKEPGRGTGLGLSTAKTIIEDNGGLIECSSVPNKGTTFYIHLPVADSSNIPLKAKEKPGAINGLNGMETILLVDDDFSILDIGKEMLGRYDYQVITACNGEEYNTPQKLDRGIRLMLACHIKKETEYGKEYSEES
jgi:two-component system, cell cycle sensor histidine kinase and response regulator CckA